MTEGEAAGYRRQSRRGHYLVNCGEDYLTESEAVGYIKRKTDEDIAW